MKILAIIDGLPGGSHRHAVEVLKILTNIYGHDILVFEEPFHFTSNSLDEIRKYGLMVHDINYRFQELCLNYSNNISKMLMALYKFLINNEVYCKFIINELTNDLMHNNIKFDVILDVHESGISLVYALYLAKKLNVPIIKVLQNEPFRTFKWFGRGYRHVDGIYGLLEDSYVFLEHRLTKAIYSMAMKGGMLRGIASVSQVPIYYSNIEKLSNKYGVKLRIYRYGNAFDKDLIYRYRNIYDKRDYAVFFGRLTPAKGAWDIIKVAKYLHDINILVFGPISNRIRDRFLRNLPNNLKYMGYRPINELYDYVARAKALIYPSHVDSFPLVILETIALGTSAVAYDIPAIRLVYGGLKPVHMVREYDISSLAHETKRIINMSIDEYVKEHEDERTRRFLKEHDSWEKVAQETLDFIYEVLGERH
ncbi:glycosyl transferase group 1 [Vulcanisaeta distributa DSM 14429]|uniref:Glycosyl transferase group 1 n=2 Tax=Vulcanisaeta distributa TaxID=164451 RepID=E1QTD5_VULDI|nr:glycosyl transferase group 1 [Vulcanisaeta distributa DSM 14429]